MARKIIDKSFPNLKGFKIFVREGKLLIRRFYAVPFYTLFFGFVMVHPRSRKFSKEELEALMAHEISHLEILHEMNFRKKLKFALKWVFTKKAKSDFETAADMRAIERGYCKGLLNFAKRIESENPNTKRHENGYLDSKQIMNTMRPKFLKNKSTRFLKEGDLLLLKRDESRNQRIGKDRKAGPEKRVG